MQLTDHTTQHILLHTGWQGPETHCHWKQALIVPDDSLGGRPPRARIMHRQYLKALHAKFHSASRVMDDTRGSHTL